MWWFPAPSKHISFSYPDCYTKSVCFLIDTGNFRNCLHAQLRVSLNNSVNFLHILLSFHCGKTFQLWIILELFPILLKSLKVLWDRHWSPYVSANKMYVSMMDFPSFARNLMLTHSTIAFDLVGAKDTWSASGHGQNNCSMCIQFFVRVKRSSQIDVLPISWLSVWLEMSNKSAWFLYWHSL